MPKRKIEEVTEKKKRVQYDRKKIEDAVIAIKTNKMGIREASRKFKIPRTTLQDRLSGRICEINPKIGRDTVLTKSEEKVIVEWIESLAKFGFPRKKSDLLNAVQDIIKADNRSTVFVNGRPGNKWYNLFLKRHPQIVEKIPESIDQARAEVTGDFIKSWFRGLHKYLTETNNIDILKDPRRILNGAETSLNICPKTGKVLAPKGYKNIYEIIQGNEKETLTLMLVISASGEYLPPMVIFPYIRHPPLEVINSAPSSLFIGISDSGWMSSEVFYEYVANCVNKWLSDNNIPRPVLLFVDGHKTHLTKYLSTFCEENGIILYALPPNCTHILQPADVSVFIPLKDQWRSTVENWKNIPRNKDKTLNKVTFCPLLKETLNQLNSDSITNGFKRCGLFPFNPDEIDYSKCVKKTIRADQLSKNKNTSLSTISKYDFEVTVKVLKICDLELKNAGYSPEVIKEIISKKRDIL